MHSCPLSHIYEQLLLKPYFQNPNVLKWIIKTIFINSSPFALLIINVKILSNFQKEWCTLGRKKGCLKKTKIVHSWGFNALNMQKQFWFVLSVENVNFAINGKYFQKHYDNPNHYASLAIFQTYKNAILRNVHSLRWLLWLWFYPMITLFGYKIIEHYKKKKNFKKNYNQHRYCNVHENYVTKWIPMT